IFLSGTKRYHGIMVLGVETDTQDGTGKVLKELPVPAIMEKDLQVVEKDFTGALQQVPPMFSALKRDGVRLYRLARQGKEVPRDPRPIWIHELRIEKMNERELKFAVTCSRGTYVRTLAADMGRRLGCGAYLKTLRRVGCDHLDVARAIRVEDLVKIGSATEIPLVSLETALNHLRAVVWQSRLVSRLRLGQQEVLGQIGPRQGCEEFVAILEPRGALAALAKWVDDMPGGRWRLFRVFRS
ncbi:MAG TPA: pseudouridine synthase, partial [Candidatus Eisenbacteria bacterium]|nr:pseudouridine synthase [Candidatus Eisenbacteria bacterium]